MSKEIEELINKDKLDIKHLKLLKIRQSLEGIFIVMVIFFVVITIGDMVFTKNKKKIEEIGETAKNNFIHVEGGFDESITMNGLREMDRQLNGDIKIKNKVNTEVKNNSGVIKVTVKNGDTIYSLFKKNGIEYSKKNIEKVKKLNKKKNLRVLKVGDEILLPSN